MHEGTFRKGLNLKACYIKDRQPQVGQDTSLLDLAWHDPSDWIDFFTIHAHPTVTWFYSLSLYLPSPVMYRYLSCDTIGQILTTQLAYWLLIFFCVLKCDNWSNWFRQHLKWLVPLSWTNVQRCLTMRDMSCYESLHQLNWWLQKDALRTDIPRLGSRT